MQHDWLTVLKGVFNPYDVDIQPLSQVTVVNPGYFKNLTTLIRDIPLRCVDFIYMYFMGQTVPNLCIYGFCNLQGCTSDNNSA